jgi:hypothetical protein
LQSSLFEDGFFLVATGFFQSLSNSKSFPPSGKRKVAYFYLSSQFLFPFFATKAEGAGNL